MSSAQVADHDRKNSMEHGFRWLSRAGRGSPYNSLSLFSHLPACSFDWGSAGYAGCSNNGGELLSLSQPSSDNGVIMATGVASESLYASLYRTQIEFGGPATFGLEVSVMEEKYPAEPKGTSFQLGSMIERGCFNYRWPLNEYHLEELRDEPTSESGGSGLSHAVEDARAGACQMFSCAMERGAETIFYQILRIEENGPFRRFPDEAQVALTIGGPVWFRKFKGDERKTQKRDESDPETVQDRSSDGLMRYYDETRQLGLEAQVHQLDPTEPSGWRCLRLTPSDDERDSGTVKTQEEGVSAYNTFGAIETLDTKNNRNAPNRTAVFLASIRLFQGEVDTSRIWPTPPSSSQLCSYVGATPSSSLATGTMWETLFLDRQQHPEASQIEPELGEINLIGRSLEKIMHVDLVPASFTPETTVVSTYGKSSTAPLALVSNLFIRPEIDLASMFWKTRFLVQARAALAAAPECPLHPQRQHTWPGTAPGREPAQGTECPYADQDSHLCVAVEKQKSRIEKYLHGILRYLSMALLSPRDESGVQTVMMPDDNIRGNTTYYYVMTTIWYVLKNLPESSHWAIWPKQTMGKQHAVQVVVDDTKLYDSHRLPRDGWTYESTEVTEATLLQWYHYGSILKLWKKGLVRIRCMTQTELASRVRQLEKVVKIALAAKLTSRLPYIAEDEIIDRLSFLSAELGLETNKVVQVETIGSLASKRIRERDSTRTLKPGWFPQDGLAATSGPWEIHTLCHHSQLVSVHAGRGREAHRAWQASSRRVNNDHQDSWSSRWRISSFLNAEGTLIACWERDHESESGGWLQSETSAIVATTLLMLGCTPVDDEHAGTAPDAAMWQGDVNPYQRRGSAGTESYPEIPFASHHLMGHVVQLVEDRLNAVESFIGEQQRMPAIDWMAFRPPRLYYPKSFTSSIESTPENYWAEALRSINLPSSLNDFVTRPGKKDFNWDDLLDEAIADCIRLWDIKCRAKNYDNEVNSDAWEITESGKDTPHLSEVASKARLQMALFRSLVDQELQHRVILVKNPHMLLPGPKGKVLDVLTYVVHPESAACLGNHMLGYTGFLCESLDQWMASITLTYWRLATEDSGTSQTPPANSDPPENGGVRRRSTGSLLDEPKEATVLETTVLESTNNDDGNPNGPQANLPSKQQPKGLNGHTVIEVPGYATPNLVKAWKSSDLSFQIDVSSMVMSTNAFGDFSKLTIVSGVMGVLADATAGPEQRDRDRKAEHIRMLRAAKRSRNLWQQFIHQPQTARCLVFLLVLGRVVELIELQYAQVLAQIEKIRDLWESEAMARKKSTMSAAELAAPSLYGGPEVHKMHLWAFETLNAVKGTLKASLDTINEAKESMFKQIADGPGRRDENLEKICQRELDYFNGSLAKLNARSASLDQTVSTTERSIETGQRVLELDYDEAAKRQNSSLQRLTYLTIGYLPVTLMAALFAIPPERQVVSTSLTLEWFLVLIVVISVLTYWLAANLGIFVGLYNSVVPNLNPVVWYRWVQGRADPAEQAASREFKHLP